VKILDHRRVSLSLIDLGNLTGARHMTLRTDEDFSGFISPRQNLMPLLLFFFHAPFRISHPCALRERRSRRALSRALSILRMYSLASCPLDYMSYA
jgi:hypothetical protein